MVMETRELPNLPSSIYLESTNRCNLFCQTCVRTFRTVEGEKDLDLPTQLNVLDQLPKLDRVVLHGIGEPMLNRDLPALIQDAKSRGAHVVFNSNGTLLTKRKAMELIEAGLDEYRLSLDSATPETYIKVRGADMFAKIIENVRNLQEIKRECGVSHPRVSVWITGLKENLHELPALIELAVELRCDEVNLQRLVFFGEGLAKEEQTVFANFEQELEEIVAKSAQLCEQKGILFRASGGVEGKEYAARQKEAQSAARPWSKCMRPWSLTYVTANGNVLPCCISPWVTEDYSSIIMGNVHKQSMEEIWHGEKYTEFRNKLLSDDPPESCKNCGVAWSL
jgi:radical SAM protein with 4Fe4S-binding SPASM domain